MSEFQIVTLILLAVCGIDAAGDAFRARKWQVIHHSMEVLGITAWFTIWALFEFQAIYLVMYITGRIFIFDVLFNLIARNKWTYVGTSSLYGRILKWFANWVKEPGFLVWVLRVMALAWWGAWFLTDGGK